MNLTEKEFMSLSGQMSDRDVKIAALEKRVLQQDRELLVARAERDEWKGKYEEVISRHVAVELENQLLRNYLWLSLKKVKDFMLHVHDIRLVGLLQTFMQKTVDDAMGARALEVINEVVVLPEGQPTAAPITNNFNAPVGQQVSNVDYMEVTNPEGGSRYE